MQEEEKNTERNDGEKKHTHHQPRRHGYFIEPPSEGSDKKNRTHSQTEAKAQGNQRTEPKAQPTQHQRHGKHKAKSHNNGAENEQAKQQDGAKKQSPQAQSAGTEAGTAKPKHSKSRSKQGNATQAPARTAAEETSRKSVAPAKASSRTKAYGATADMSAHADHSAEDYEEYVLVVPDDADKPKAKKVAADGGNTVPKTEVVGIRFKSTGKIYYFSPNGMRLTKGSKAIVDTARGQEFGEVAMANALVSTSDIIPPLRPVIRAATDADIEHNKANKASEDEAFKVCNEKIREHRLDMKLIDAQYTFDNSKLLFYFTSSNRVDFRDLVKDLAAVFHTRIELRQIGIRDEAKLMGGLGMCGRPLCCTLFLSDFDQVSIKMAKEQNLSLNSAKISGICGRLMCCLKYEHEAYEYEIKRTPPVDSLVRTENGDGVVTEISPLTGTVKVRLIASPDVPPKVYKRDEITMLRKKSTDGSK